MERQEQKRHAAWTVESNIITIGSDAHRTQLTSIRYSERPYQSNVKIDQAIDLIKEKTSD